MKLKGKLDEATLEAMVRECLQRRFTGMVVTDVSVGYVSGEFELDDASSRAGESMPATAPEPINADGSNF